MVDKDKAKILIRRTYKNQVSPLWLKKEMKEDKIKISSLLIKRLHFPILTTAKRRESDNSREAPLNLLYGGTRRFPISLSLSQLTLILIRINLSHLNMSQRLTIILDTRLRIPRLIMSIEIKNPTKLAILLIRESPEILRLFHARFKNWI
jgi:hypothetical protein